MTEPGAEKKSLTFSFSKSKPKVNLVKNDKIKAFDFDGSQSKLNDNGFELITGLEGKRVKSLKPAEPPKQPLSIPCPKNELNFSVPGKGGISDLDVINALITDSKIEKEKTEAADIAMPEAEKVEKKIAEPDYGCVQIEQFGLAALRGMGWSEKKGLGLNKRQVDVIEVECRPRGLGLGAGSSKKKKTDADNAKKDEENGLRYATGCYIQITSGKNENEYGRIVSFGDGLSRIVVELEGTDEKVSVLQACTRLMSKSDFKRATEKRRR